MHAIPIMLGAAFLWSLYPLFIALAEGHIGAALLVFVVHVSCGLAAGVFAYIKTKRKMNVRGNLIKVIKNLEFEHWLYLLLIGLVSTLYNFCFIYAMEVGSKIGTAIIIEGWPIIAIFLAPLLITKAWKKVTFIDYMAALIALCGIALIMVEDFSQLDELVSLEDTGNILGAIAALIGGICLAASVVLSTEVSNVISRDILKEKKPGLACAFWGETIRRIMAFPVSIMFLFAFPEDGFIDARGFGLAVFIGVVIFCLGSAAVTIALLRSSSSTINMIYYVSPILAVLWLYLADLGQITWPTVIGGVLVILANLVTINKNRKNHLSNEAIKKA
jgi:drug/metabolite transporter (DMT)-like permease